MEPAAALQGLERPYLPLATPPGAGHQHAGPGFLLSKSVRVGGTQFRRTPPLRADPPRWATTSARTPAEWASRSLRLHKAWRRVHRGLARSVHLRPEVRVHCPASRASPPPSPPAWGMRTCTASPAPRTPTAAPDLACGGCGWEMFTLEHRSDWEFLHLARVGGCRSRQYRVGADPEQVRMCS